jgi:hypothetical protein
MAQGVLMPDFTQKPDDKFLKDAHAYLKDTWRDAHADWSTLDSFLHRTYEVWIKPDEAEKINRPDYRPSKPANMVKAAVAAMTALSPKVHRNPVGVSKDAKDDADEAEVGLAAILTDTAVQAKLHPWRTASAYLVHYNYAVLMGPLPKFPTGWEHDPDTNPIEITAPNPTTVLMDPEEKEAPFAIRQGKMPAIKIYELSKRKAQGKGKRKDAVLFDMNPYKEDPFQEVFFQEYWTKRWHAFRVPTQETPEQLLYVEVNPLGFLPFTHAFGGFGMEPSNLEKNVKFLARGILWDALDSIRLHAQAQNAKMQNLIDAVFAALVTEEDPEEIKRQLAEGADIVRVENVEGTRPMATNQIARWIFQVTDELNEDIEAATGVRNLTGLREQGVVTVGQQSLLENRARQQFNLPLLQVEYMATITGSRIYHLVDNMKQLEGVIGARGKRIRKAQLHGNYNCGVKFEPRDPAMALQREQQGLAEVQLGVKDYETYWEEDKGVTNISERWNRLARQEVRLSPDMWALFLQEAAEEAGVGDEFQAARQAKAEAEGAGPTGSGGAGGNGAVRPLREPLSDGTVKPAPLRGPQPGGV